LPLEPPKNLLLFLKETPQSPNNIVKYGWMVFRDLCQEKLEEVGETIKQAPVTRNATQIGWI
jgi:hypothetical protein